MVFSSVPLYLDPYNWQHHQQQQSHQQQLQQQLGGHGSSSQQNLQLPLSSSAPDGAPLGSIRPGSMADRARLAKLPMPEPGLKCPRCESTNTKFCYFNNYSLSQPRHFCKTCRRYWTRGGALRNVPVGGGCRRNKRPSTKNNSAAASSSKSHAAINNISDDIGIEAGGGPPICSSSNNNSGSGTGIGFPLLASLQGLNSQSNLGLNFSGGINIQPPPPQIGIGNDHNQSASILGFHVGSSSTSNYPNFLSGFEPPPPPPSTSLYTFHDDDHQHQNVEAPALLLPSSTSIFGGTHHHQHAISEDQNHNAPPDNVKAEEALRQGFDIVSSSRSLMGGVVSENNHDQFWDGNGNNAAAWADFSGINNSSCSATTRNNM